MLFSMVRRYTILHGGNMKKEFEVYARKSAFTPLEGYCYFARKDDYIEITEWSNGEGFDVSILSISGEKSFSLTGGEFDALNQLVEFVRTEKRFENEN
jgi:hypothetical protein